MKDEKKHIINLSLNNKNIHFYRIININKILMKIDSIHGIYIKGIYIDNNIITSRIILDNDYIYLPDINYTTEQDLLLAVIKRDIYIETQSIKYYNKDKVKAKDLYHKKNLPFNCLNNNDIKNILNNM